MSNVGIYDWRGQIYHGQKAVAKAAGVSQSQVSRHLNLYGNLDHLGVGTGNHVTRKPFEVGPRAYASKIAFAREIGVSMDTVSRWERSKGLEALVAAVEARKGRVQA